MKDAFEDSEDQAEEVSERIDAVEHVAEALFEEWDEELSQYTNQNLKRASAAKLRETKHKYAQLMRAMRKSEQSLTPVLNSFRDQVLFLKHNLNAKAIASIKNELRVIRSDVKSLIKQMNASISVLRPTFF